MIREAKRAKCGGGSDNWFITERTSNVLPVPITRGSELKKAIERVVEDKMGPDGGYTKVIEKGGEMISKGLGPMLETHGCEYENQGGACLVVKGSCTRARVCYRITCRICDERLELEYDDRVFKKDDPRLKYLGTTGRTAHNRSIEHQEGYIKRKPKNALWKHWSSKHRGEYQLPAHEAYEMTLLTSHRSNLHRLATEALMIEQSVPDTLMNSRSEWSRNKLIRQTTTTQNV